MPFLFAMRRRLVNLNLFESGSEEVLVVREERWSTRLYLVLLCVTLVTLVFYAALRSQTETITVRDPSKKIFDELELKYSNTLQCPCTKIAIEYGRFVHIEPSFHQVNLILKFGKIREGILTYDAKVIVEMLRHSFPSKEQVL